MSSWSAYYPQGVKSQGRPVREGPEETVRRHLPAPGEDGGAGEEHDESLPPGARSHRGKACEKTSFCPGSPWAGWVGD